MFNFQDLKRIDDEYVLNYYNWNELPIHIKKLVVSKMLLDFLRKKNISLKSYLKTRELTYSDAIKGVIATINKALQTKEIKCFVVTRSYNAIYDNDDDRMKSFKKIFMRLIKLTSKHIENTEDLKNKDLNTWLKPAFEML